MSLSRSQNGSAVNSVAKFIEDGDSQTPSSNGQHTLKPDVDTKANWFQDLEDRPAATAGSSGAEARSGRAGAALSDAGRFMKSSNGAIECTTNSSNARATAPVASLEIRNTRT